MLENLTLGELLGWMGAAAVVLSGFVEVSKIKLNPWSTLARHIGRAINGEVLDRVDSLGDQVGKLSEKVDQSEARQDERDAKTARTHILRFGDEVRIGARHSKESFDEVLADITAYESYCKAHPEFPNNRTRAAEKFITETYDECLRENKFL